MAGSDIYSRLLLPTGNGYPLFHPQPFDDLPEPARRTGTAIGDVGIVTSNGSFDPIFNILRAGDDPVNRFGVPLGFERLILRPNSIQEQMHEHLPGAHISNSTINKRRLDIEAGLEANVFVPFGAGAVIEVSTKSKETGLLLLPDGASRRDLRSLQNFRDYALKHTQSWYAFVNGDLGRMIANGDLYLVTGVTKSTSWSVAADENQSGDGNLSLKLKATRVGNAGGTWAWEWEGASSSKNSGPRRRPGEESWGDNQTLFIRGFKVALRSFSLRRAVNILKIPEGRNSKWSKISSKSFPSSSQTRSDPTPMSNVSPEPSNSEGEDSNPNPTEDDWQNQPRTPGGSDSASDDEVPSVYHPADIINQYLLNSAPGAMVAVTHDDDWISVLDGADKKIPEDQELIKRISNNFTIEIAKGGVHLQAAGPPHAYTEKMQTPALDRIVFPQGRPVVVLSAGPRRTTISGTYNDLAGPNESPFAPNPFAFLQEVNETSKRGLEKELGKDYVAIQDALASIIREQELSKHYAAMPDVVAAIIQSLEARKNFLQFQFSPNSFQPNSQSTSYTRTGQGTINSIDGALYGYTQNSGFLGTDQREYHNNPTTYNFQAAASPTPLTATGFSAITTGTTTPARSPYYPPRSGSSQPGQTKVKRQRVPEPINEPKDEDMEEEEGGARAKPPGACVRCKNLKVKCEFKTKTDPCKRCFNGGHDCVTPGRKKRRTPPKRERLLNQIREQAAEIQKLMAQLEETNARAHPPNSSATDAFPLSPSSGSDLQSPVLSPSTNASYFGSDPSSSRDDSEAEKAVEDWIAKARDSLAEFDGFIGIGGAGMPKSYLIKEDLEDSNSEEEQEGASSDEPAPEYEIEVLDSEGEEVTHRGRRNKIRQLSSSSSTNGARSPKKKDSGGMDKLATLPSEASPFGLMADVSLKMGRAESPEDM